MQTPAVYEEPRTQKEAAKMPVPYVCPNVSVRILQSICASVPLLTGQSTLIQLPPFKWVKFRSDTIWVRLRSGALAHVRANDFIGRAAYFFGDHDPKITQALAAVLTRDMTLLDIGANVGTVTLGVASRVKRAIAIEPQPRCAALLRESVAANEFENVEVHELALAEQDGEMPMYGDPENVGTFSLNNYGNRPSRLTARTVQASSFLEGLKIEGDYVVKIDVEDTKSTSCKRPKATSDGTAREPFSSSTPMAICAITGSISSSSGWASACMRSARACSPCGSAMSVRSRLILSLCRRVSGSARSSRALQRTRDLIAPMPPLATSALRPVQPARHSARARRSARTRNPDRA